MRILIAVEEDYLSGLLVCCLQQYDVDVDVAATSGQFVSRSLSTPYDRIVTGYVHPFLSGFDLARQIRMADLPKPSIFFISPLRQEQFILNLYQSGVDQFISMPLNLDRLISKLLATTSRNVWHC